MSNPSRSSRFRLALALVVAMLGAIVVQTSLVQYVASMDALGGGYCCGVFVLYALVFGLAYWIAPKWG
jgi:hypothetical protein